MHTMKIIETHIEGLIEVLPDVYSDNRGWFTEVYQQEKFHALGIKENFIQDNLSFSKQGVIRGLHFQLDPFAQAKMVRVFSGRVLDVVVDVRKNSKTFGHTYSCELNAEKQNILFIPAGFAHGFAALTDAMFYYKCSNVYNKTAEAGIIWNDKDLQIDWKIEKPIISDKDTQLPSFKEILARL